MLIFLDFRAQKFPLIFFNVNPFLHHDVKYHQSIPNGICYYFDDTSQLYRTGHDDVSRTKMRALTLILFSYLPFDVFMHIRVRSVI